MKDLISYIKGYSTRDFIYFFAEESISIFNNQVETPVKGLNCTKTYPLNAILHGFMRKKVDVMLSAWDVQSLAYLSILYANDYRKKTIQKDEVGTIVNMYRGYENEHSGSGHFKKAEITDIFKFIMGMTYEQFKYQNLAWTYQSFNRNYHMLIGSENINRKQIVDINKITKELFGLNVDEFLTAELIILWLCSKHPDPLSAPEQTYRKKHSSILTRENLQKVIGYYSVPYSEVRESQLKKQIFYRKPFVITKKTGETIAISFYLVQMLLADGLYWLVRDYYQENNWGLKFINAFGEMFEDYFEEIANLYLSREMWNKIPEQKKKSADYFIEVNDAYFLFELKSGLLGIGAKQQVPDVQRIDKFYNRNIREAYEQLKASEQAYEGQKPVIKVFLLYENMTNTQIIMSSIPEIFVEDRRCYIMSIDDLEMMLATYKNDRDKFDRIVRALADNINSNIHYKSVLKVLNDYEAIGNMHFIDERDYYKKIMERLEGELK